MKTLGNLIRRDLRLFFKDKGLFFSSMLTPLILLVLYSIAYNGLYMLPELILTLIAAVILFRQPVIKKLAEGKQQ